VRSVATDELWRRNVTSSSCRWGILALVRRSLACLVLGGCSFSLAPGIGGDDGSGAIDAPGDADAPAIDASLVDGSVDGPPADAAPNCFGAAPHIICTGAAPAGVLSQAPTTALTLTYLTSTCNTGEIINPGNGGPEVCVHDYTSVSLNSISRIRAEGSRPLVILSSGDIQIDGAIEVVGDLAAGGSFPGCPTAPAGGSSGGGGGGGAGGSFRTTGGNGGDVSGGGSGGDAVAGTATAPAFLRGGCPGGSGGNEGGVTGGAAGRGGGAVYLLAAGRLVINGRVNASGAGGAHGGNGRSGGGGGGSGGMIVLFGGTGITVDPGAQLWANGGGGGGGSDAGNPGGDGTLSTGPGTPGAGGVGGASGATSGGAGNLATQPGASATNGNKAGGGGGGGGGWIENASGGPITPGVFSPPAS